VAKNIVVADLADQCEVELASAIGVAEPVFIFVDQHGTGKVSDDELVAKICKVFDLTPAGMIDYLKLRNPVFRNTAAYGHFGREEEGFTWEKADQVDELV